MDNTILKIGLFLCFIMAFMFLTGCDPIPPVQPESGPGGMDYPYPDKPYSKLTEPENPENLELAYTIFKPQPAEADKEFPVILFLHGHSGEDPGVYLSWIEHIVKKGHIVIYPKYQNLGTDDEPKRKRYLISAISAAKLALEELQISPDHYDDLQFALIGHSLGGTFAAYIAATWEIIGLPAPDVLLLADPTDANLVENPVPWQEDLQVDVPKYVMPEGSDEYTFEGSDIYENIPSSTLLLSILSANYTTQPMYDWTKEVFIKSTNVYKQNKNMIAMLSDPYGDDRQSWLFANHFTVNAMVEDENEEYDEEEENKPLLDLLLEMAAKVNALDYNGYWKLFDGLCGAAFAGDANAKKYALWDGEGSPLEEQTSLGVWSDGKVATPLIVFAADAVDYLPANLDNMYSENIAILKENMRTQIEEQNDFWTIQWDKYFKVKNGSN